jgi:hypothetical protein
MVYRVGGVRCIMGEKSMMMLTDSHVVQKMFSNCA